VNFPDEGRAGVALKPGSRGLGAEGVISNQKEQPGSSNKKLGQHPPGKPRRISLFLDGMLGV
jgi:hypothetical protein